MRKKKEGKQRKTTVYKQNYSDLDVEQVNQTHYPLRVILEGSSPLRATVGMIEKGFLRKK